ncbi:MAG: hypothetical protein C0522_01365 [Rhodocyclaceae bacterium]|jgi:hypothetical protein|nr:hypothetical protein [Rhodocyclaceae bacterium]
MKDYAEIEVYIAEARRLRSEAVGAYLAAGWDALGRGLNALAALVTHKVKSKDPGRQKPYLPA